MAVSASEIYDVELAPDLPLPSAGASACGSCGSPMESGDRFCPACGAASAEGAIDRSAPGTPAAVRHLKCNNCGAEVQIDPDQRSYVCAFCDSTYVVELPPAETGRQDPEFVIGFAIPLDDARDRFRRWFQSNSWFRPRDLARAEIVEQLRGVYVPFWSFTLLARSSWSAQIGEYWYRTETYTTVENGKTVTKTRRVRETEWWPLRGGHHAYYSGFLISASGGLPHQVALQMQPYRLAALKRYRPQFLAGWAAEEYSVAREEALTIATEEFQRREQNAVANHLPGDEHRGLSVSTGFSDINSDLVLLPVYMLTYRYRGKNYRFVMNGQTGRVTGAKPVSAVKVAIAVALGVAAALVAWGALSLM